MWAPVLLPAWPAWPRGSARAWRGFGLIIFYIGLAAGPMSIAILAGIPAGLSTILPVAVALAEGERPGAAGVYAGALLCLVAIVLASSAGDAGAVAQPDGRGRAGPSATASPRVPCSACSSSSSVTQAIRGNCGPWQPGGSASWPSS